MLSAAAVRRFIPFVNDWCDLSTIPAGMDKTKCPDFQDPKTSGTKRATQFSDEYITACEFAQRVTYDFVFRR